MENRIAVDKIKYLKPNPIFVVHQNIVEINAKKTAASRTFKCLDCGHVWTEGVHAPLLLTRAEVNHYYPQAKNCSILN